MPTYEFRCPDGTIVEKIFKMSEVPESIPNPVGEGVAVRIISIGGGLLFKGTGFYITDYGKDGKKDQRAAMNESKSADKSGDSAPTTGNTEPAEKKGSGSGGEKASSAANEGSSSGSAGKKDKTDAGSSKPSTAAAPPTSPSKKSGDA